MLTTGIADKVLRSIYLDVVTENINTQTHPFYNMISSGSENVVGKDIVAPCRFGINGGIGCGSEDGILPNSSPTAYIELKAALINMFGNLEISDKVLRASANSSGAIINVLNTELESLINAAKFNFARMLHQDSNGILTKVATHSVPTGNYVAVKTTKHLTEGMVVDFYKNLMPVANGTGFKVTYVDRDANAIKLDKAPPSGLDATVELVVQNSYGREMFGLPYLFDTTIATLYGLLRSSNTHLLPVKTSATSLDCDTIQRCLDTIEEKSGGGIDFIITSYEMRRKYFNTLLESRTNIDFFNLDGGFKTIRYNGIPVFCDKFCADNAMYFLNSEDFKLHQLGEWNWLESESGNVLRPLDNKPAYAATLVKYANIICSRPMNQCKLTLTA